MIHPTVLTEIDLRNGRAPAAIQARIVTPEQAAADAELWQRVALWAQAHDAGRYTVPPDAAKSVNKTMTRALQRAPHDRHSIALIALSRALAIAIDVHHDAREPAGFGPACQAHTAALQAAQQEERNAA